MKPNVSFPLRLDLIGYGQKSQKSCIVFTLPGELLGNILEPVTIMVAQSKPQKPVTIGNKVYNNEGPIFMFRISKPLFHNGKRIKELGDEKWIQLKL